MADAIAQDVGPLADQLDRLSLHPLHVFIIAACALGLGFDLAEIALGGVLSAMFSAPPHLVDPKTLSWLLAAAYIGVIGGASLGGWLADHHGRRRVMLVVLLFLAATSAAAAASPDMDFLILARGLSGLALGAYPPLMGAYLTDILPARRRGPLIMVAVALGTLGPLILIFVVRWLTPIEPLGIEAWRWAFIIGAVGAAICALMFWHIPESPRWLISQGRLAEARATLAMFGIAFETKAGTEPTGGHGEVPAPIASPDRGRGGEAAGLDRRSFARRMGFLVAIYFLTPWATVGFPVLSGAVLIAKGIDVKDSLLYIGVSSLGPTIGAIIAGLVIDRIERKTALLICAAAMAVLGLVFGGADLPLWLVTTGLLFNLLIAIFLPVLVIYAAELFPTGQRARATSWAWAARGIGSALTPLALLPLLKSSGPLAMFAVMGATLAAFAALLALFGPRGEAGRAIR